MFQLAPIFCSASCHYTGSQIACRPCVRLHFCHSSVLSNFIEISRNVSPFSALLEIFEHNISWQVNDYSKLTKFFVACIWIFWKLRVKNFLLFFWNCFFAHVVEFDEYLSQRPVINIPIGPLAPPPATKIITRWSTLLPVTSLGGILSDKSLWIMFDWPISNIIRWIRMYWSLKLETL